MLTCGSRPWIGTICEPGSEPARGDPLAPDGLHVRVVAIEVVLRIDRHVVACFGAREADGTGLCGELGSVVGVVEMSMAEEDVVRIQVDEILNDEGRTARLDLQTRHKGVKQHW